ncbi:MAG: hypothetical protein PHC88_00695 [Terrimicrobiaceae bacterium]|nr:hypothetical protein [Terrimicrobiaceae bacterium]
MAWFTSPDNCINRPQLPAGWLEQIINGRDAVGETIAKSLLADLDRLQRPCFLALDGYKGAKLQPFLDGIRARLEAAGVEVAALNVNDVFRSKAEIDEIARPCEKPEDPSFGRVFAGNIEDLIDPAKVRATTERWEKLRAAKGRRTVLICHGVGAGLALWRHLFDRAAFCDVTREQVIIRSERGGLLPVGEDVSAGYPFKRIYYFEYPLLNRHKKQLLKSIDWYIDDSGEEDPKLVPAEVYHALITELAGRPVCFKVFYMPGMFGGTEFSKRFNVPGLPNNSWDYEISVGDNHLLIDPGDGRILEMPFYNLIWEQPLRFLGAYSSATYPDHFPIAIYMQDGWFADPKEPGFKRTHMPNHIHPDTAYCREHFNEPIGRYETYYIVRADEGACTMHGFKDDADIDAYIGEVRKSAETHEEFDWRKYIHEHPSKTGELHQLPPGTVHGTGGRQVILEIDTNPSRESTEYSFFLYDYCRPCFNYEKLDMTGKPLKLTVEHSLAIMRRNRRQKYMAEKVRPAPVCIRSGEDWREMSFPMHYNMPYQINRFEFKTKVEDDTRDMFHCIALTLGTKVRVYSKRDPSNEFVLEDCDNIVLPAGFGPYVLENLGDGPCEIIKTFLITEPRAHIDKEQEEKDWGVDPDGPEKVS